MYRRAFLAGTVGGIIGAITAVIGMMWSVMTIFKPNPFDIIPAYASYTTIAHYLMWAVIQSDWLFNFFVLSIIFSIFLMVSGVLLGAGFFGFYSVTNDEQAVAGPIVSLLGFAFVAFFIILGFMQPIIELKTWVYRGHYAMPILEPLTQTIVITPNYFFFSIGILALFITLIALGVISIAMRDTTMVPTVSSSSGIISIIGALFLVPYFLLLTSYFAVIGIISGFIGLILLLVAFILWTVVFFNSRNI
ncbi:MAG: hypothetical protein ACETWM_07975 [Candidatus Lokiarchaeia archaeon]